MPVQVLVGQSQMLTAGSDVNPFQTKVTINLQENQYDINNYPNFGEILSGQLAVNHQPTDETALPGVLLQVDESGNILPVDGKSLPLPNTIYRSNISNLTGTATSVLGGDTSTADGVSEFTDSFLEISEKNTIMGPSYSRYPGPDVMAKHIGPDVLRQMLGDHSRPSANADIDVSDSAASNDNDVMTTMLNRQQASRENTISFLSPVINHIPVGQGPVNSRINNKDIDSLTVSNPSIDGRQGDQSGSGIYANSLASNTTEVKSGSSLMLPHIGNSAQWTSDFTDKVRWMISSNIHKADMKLNPKNLGTIEVSISFANDQANIHIAAQNSVAKDLVEGSLGRLRDMLDTAGVNLADVDVSQHSNNQESRYQHDDAGYSNHHESDYNADDFVSETIIERRNGLIDYYV